MINMLRSHYLHVTVIYEIEVNYAALNNIIGKRRKRRKKIIPFA